MELGTALRGRHRDFPLRFPSESLLRMSPAWLASTPLLAFPGPLLRESEHLPSQGVARYPTTLSQGAFLVFKSCDFEM